jgi:myo-inositol-1(or 4)-monophosphatase
LREYLQIAEKAARLSGKLLLEKFRQVRTIEKKGRIDLVTDADRESENLIRELILKKYPSHSFIAEENSQIANQSEFVWLVDPLDGTTNYAHKFPVYCISIGLLIDDRLCAGCVYNPNLDECFTALAGQGAFRNYEAIHVSKTSTLEDSLLATGFPYDIRESSKNNLKEFASFAVSARAVRRAGSAALDLAYTACSIFDGFWEFKLKPWDMAAGILLVQEAGGIVTNYRGQEFSLSSGEILATNGLIHNQMREILNT